MNTTNQVQNDREQLWGLYIRALKQGKTAKAAELRADLERFDRMHGIG